MLDEEEVEELKQILKQEFSDYYELAGGKNYRYHHLVSVHKHVKRFLNELDTDADERVAEIAALFHDIGRTEDIEDSYLDPMENHEGHDRKGAETVSGYINDFLEPEQVEKVEKIIFNHHSKAETVEGELVQDADLLTNYGVSNLWRMIHYASEKERTMEESFKYFWETLEERYEEDLEEFYFDFTRNWAQERLERHRKTVEGMEKEFNAEDL